MASIFKRKGAKKYTIKYRNADGQWATCAGATDKLASQRIAAKLEADALLRSKGVIDTAVERLAQHERRPLGEHIEAFTLALEAKGSTARHIAGTVAYIRALTDACDFTMPADIDAAAVSAHVSNMKRVGKSARAINARLTAFKSMTRWMHRTGRIRIDPMQQVAKLNTRADRRRKRRPLNDGELADLLRFTESDGERSGMSGKARAMLYRVAVGCGLRAGECASLTPASFDLSKPDAATVAVEAAYSKRRRRDVLPIRRDLAEAVATYIKGEASDAPLFAVPDRTADMIRADLRWARIRWRREAATWAQRRQRRDSDHLRPVDQADRVADFHALRHTFITRLAKSGVAPAVAKTLARHSTITLTIDHYTHTLVEDERAALDKLPAILPVENAQPVEVAAQATGTDDAPLQRAPNMHQMGTASCHPESSSAIVGKIENSDCSASPSDQKHLKSKGKNNAGHRMSSRDKLAGVNAPPRTRTLNPLIKSQLLCQLS